MGQGRKNTLMSYDISLDSCSPITGSGNESLASGAVGRLLSVVSRLDQGLCILTKYFTIDLHPQKKRILFLKDPKMWVYQGGRRKPILINCPLT